MFYRYLCINKDFSIVVIEIANIIFQIQNLIFIISIDSKNKFTFYTFRSIFISLK